MCQFRKHTWRWHTYIISVCMCVWLRCVYSCEQAIHVNHSSTIRTIRNKPIQSQLALTLSTYFANGNILNAVRQANHHRKNNFFFSIFIFFPLNIWISREKGVFLQYLNNAANICVEWWMLCCLRTIWVHICLHNA